MKLTTPILGSIALGSIFLYLTTTHATRNTHATHNTSQTTHNQISTLIPGDLSKYLKSKIKDYIEPKPKTLDPETIRLQQMSNLLTTYSHENWQKYNQLCKQATQEPKIGMTIFQSRASTWCFPHSRNIIKTQYGEYVQEVYFQRNSDGDYNSRYSKRKFLYFENGILTSIQE